MESGVFPDVREVDLVAEDMILLCSDGLTKELSDEAIAETLAKAGDPDEACRLLVDAANSLRLATHLGQRVTVTGVVTDRTLRARSLSVVARSCN